MAAVILFLLRPDAMQAALVHGPARGEQQLELAFPDLAPPVRQGGAVVVGWLEFADEDDGDVVVGTNLQVLRHLNFGILDFSNVRIFEFSKFRMWELENLRILECSIFSFCDFLEIQNFRILEFWNLLSFSFSIFSKFGEPQC